MQAVLIQIAGLRPGAPTSSLVRTLSSRPGVRHVSVDAGSRQVTVVHDPNRITVEELRDLIAQCGLHCISHVVTEAPCPEPSTTEIV